MDIYQQYGVDEYTNPTLLETLVGLNYRQPELVAREINRLFASYGTQITFGKRHPAPCTTWRSERIQLDDETLPRFANRVHLFEKSERFGQNLSLNAINPSEIDPDEIDPDEIDSDKIDSDKIDQSDGRQSRHAALRTVRHGRYLGYVSLRPINRPDQPYYQYVAVANIIAPRYMQRPRYHLITCVAGPADGLLPFHCTPFCFPFDDIRNRASCLHTALQQALLLKMNSFDLVPVSSQEIIARLWTLKQGQRSMTSLARRGATLAEALDALNSERLGAGGVLETIPVQDFALAGSAVRWATSPELAREWVTLEAHRCMTDYLASGLPIIVEFIERKSNFSHAVLVFGMHLMHDPEEVFYPNLFSELASDTTTEASRRLTRIDHVELPGRFILHDINDGPFIERRVAHLLGRSWSEATNSEATNSEATNSEATNGEATNGEATNGEATNSEATNGEATNGEATNGDGMDGARKLEKNLGSEKGLSGISYLAITPPGTRIGIYDVRKLTRALVRQRSPLFWRTYMAHHYPDDPVPEEGVRVDDLRYVTRLLQKGQVAQCYLSTHTRSTQNRSRVHSADRESRLKELWERTAGDNRWWWSVEVSIAVSRSASLHRDTPPPPLVYLWCVEDDRDMPPRIQIAYRGGPSHMQAEITAIDPDTGRQENIRYEYRPQSA